jgi:FdrA protein
MALKASLRASYYRDSVALMRVAQALRAQPGVREAAALMGTPANHEILAGAGLADPALAGAGPADLMLAVEADTIEAAEAALTHAGSLLDERERAQESAGRAAPRTLDAALREMPDANLAMISVPGAHARLEALRALRRGLHVFLFSDNVPLAEEIELKTFAAAQGLLCMGPDCGTAYLGGVGLGFANVVARGRIGCIAASGTGLQAVASHLAAAGEGVSHGIGVGGRDLSAEVGGLMTQGAFAALNADPRTEAIVLISKPPAPGTLRALEGLIRAAAKPVVLCCLGAKPEPGAPGIWAETLEDASHAVIAALRGQKWSARAFADTAAARARLAQVRAQPGARGTALLALYSGGTLAYEAKLLLGSLLGPVRSNLGSESARSAHEILDLGADEFTVGRPHPMLDPEARAERVRAAGAQEDLGVLLVDLVLGRGAHADPAAPLARAIEEARGRARAAGRALTVVASVVGTERDPQPLAAQVGALEAAGAIVLPGNAQAARFAALVLRPELEASLLEAA